MENKYDVIVVGAGPAGASCARILSRARLKVLLIEKSQEIGAPNFSSAGTPDYVIKEFDLPKSVIATYWDKFEIVTKSSSNIWYYKKPRGFVLKFNELKKFMVEDAIKHGCQVLVGTSAVKMTTEKNQTFVDYSGINKGKARAKIVVDASGPSGILATQLKLRKATPAPPSTGLEYIMENVRFKNKNNLAFYLGPEFAPHGYAWIFPMGSTTAKVGIATYTTTKYKLPPLLELLNQFIQKIDMLKNAQPTELHGGTLYASTGLKKLVHKNFLAIGDAAVQVNPLGAEGIRHSLYASKFASSAIKQSITKNNLSYLKNYEKSWKKYVGNRWKISYILSKIVYEKTSDKIFDKAQELIRSLSADEIFDIMFRYKFSKIFKIMAKFPISKIKILGTFFPLRSLKFEN